MASIQTWKDFSQAFLYQYYFNIDLIPKRENLVVIRQRPHEPFEEYVGRWRSVAIQVRDGPSVEESIDIIIKEAQSAIGAPLFI